MSEAISTIDYREVIEYSLEPVIIHTDYQILYINRAAESFFRTTKEGVIGLSPLDIFQDSSREAIKERIQSAYSKPAEVIEELLYRMDGTTVEAELYCHPVTVAGKQAIQSYIRDIGWKREANQRQVELIKEINELSATVVPLLDDIAILPITGKIDHDKAVALLDLIPVKVREQQITYLIIDFSGMYSVDNLVIDTLFKVHYVLGLLGVGTFITGLRPELVLEALNLDIDLSSLPVTWSVKEALDILEVKHEVQTS
ncbi:PAS domain S-box protein [Rossellomorea sp. RS05]|uniref:PAS domain S-box protein n=1 Tax=Rossellomorea sp. RS05 TaxID=3149166 RepID=UPI001C47DF86|nr:PAS domain S-box protein [Bacillus sp. JRC01]